jgi:hypothetical protein
VPPRPSSARLWPSRPLPSRPLRPPPPARLSGYEHLRLLRGPEALGLPFDVVYTLAAQDGLLRDALARTYRDERHFLDVAGHVIRARLRTLTERTP